MVQFQSSRSVDIMVAVQSIFQDLPRSKHSNIHMCAVFIHIIFVYIHIYKYIMSVIFRYLDSYEFVNQKGFNIFFFPRRPREHSGSALVALVLWRAWSISSCNMAAGFQTTFRRSSSAAT